MKSKNKIIIISILSIIILANFVFIYFFSFKIILDQILSRADSDTNNLISLISKSSSIGDAVEIFNDSRNLEINIVDENYQVLYTTDLTLRSQYFSNNITEAKSEGVASSFIKQDLGKSLSLIYSKKGSFKNSLIIVSIEYPFLLYWDFKHFILLIFFLTVLIIALNTYLITNSYISSYILNLNRYVETSHVNNDSSNSDFEFTTSSENKDVVRLIETLNTYRNKYDSILENDKKRFSKVTSFLSNIPTGLIIVDNDRVISLINEKAEKIFNLNKREIIEQTDIDGFEVVYNIWEKVVNTKKIIVKDINIKEIIVEIEALPMRDKYSPFEFIGVLFLLRDVTKIREIENMKNDFVSNVSHELRTPLTIISGLSQTLNNKNIEEEDRQFCIDSIDKEVNKLSFLINELLLLSKVDNGQIQESNEVFNPTQIIREQVAYYFERSKEKDILIQVELEKKESCRIYTNKVYFRQIITNLIDNALKYSPSKTLITIEEKITDNNYMVSIKDQGIGISKDDQKKIFERFYRVEKSRNSETAGSGLGLSIVKSFLDSIGGEVKVESELNKGSTFTIIFRRDYNV